MLEAIKKRQSVRKYTDEEVTKEELIEIIKAGMRAPSARNRQPWRLVVVTKKEDLMAIHDFEQSYRMMDTASKAIIVLGDKDVQIDEFIYEDCACFIENMLIQAKEMGLGTCYCAIAPKESAIESFKNRFHFTDNLLPVAVVAIGYPTEDNPLQDRYDESKITWL